MRERLRCCTFWPTGGFYLLKGEGVCRLLIDAQKAKFPSRKTGVGDWVVVKSNLCATQERHDRARYRENTSAKLTKLTKLEVLK